MKGAAVRLASSVVVAIALFSGVAFASAGPVASASPSSPSWSVVPSPDPPAPAGATGGAGLNAIACPTPTSCVVVGDYRNGAALPLVGHSAGANWSITAAPQPASHKNPSGQLSTVACPTTSRCFGVGYYDNGASTRALIEQWNGTTWSIITNPKMPGTTKSSLSGIACPTSKSCFAVGYANRASTKSQVLVEHWNGAGWSVVDGANPPGGGQLGGISCLSNSSCVAVGMSNGPTVTTRVERWNGKTWTAVASPNIAHATANALSAVSCPTKNACFAVGYYFGNGLESPTTLTERSNGDTWSIVATPDKQRFGGGEGSALGGIACLSASMCFAVGYFQSNFTPARRVMRWDGKSWSIIRVPHPGVHPSESFSGITCASTTSCVAVGSNSYGTLIEKWNGTTWSEVRAGGSAGHLASVSCPSTTMCFAVGASAPGFRYFSDNAALIEQWNGSSWQLVPTPDPSPGANFEQLSSISCPTTTSCFAVGAFGSSSSTEMLIEHWDGTRWTVVSVPHPVGSASVLLTAIACGSPTNCVAIGGSEPPSGVSFLERWDGTTWSTEFPASAPDGALPVLGGVSCASASSCVAVGGYDSGTVGSAFIEEWDGVTWSVAATPHDPSATRSSLSGVTCPAVDRCYAVGTLFDTDSSTDATLVEQWDGTAWSIVPSPNPASAFSSELTSVSCLAPGNCFVVGTGFATDGTKSAVLEHWDGTSWSLVPISPPAGAQNTELDGITCGSTSCTAVGLYETPLARWTLVERYG